MYKRRTCCSKLGAKNWKKTMETKVAPIYLTLVLFVWRKYIKTLRNIWYRSYNFGPHNSPYFKMFQVHWVLTLYSKRFHITYNFIYLFNLFALTGSLWRKKFRNFYNLVVIFQKLAFFLSFFRIRNIERHKENIFVSY